jgi:hypothetical protein
MITDEGKVDTPISASNQVETLLLQVLQKIIALFGSCMAPWAILVQVWKRLIFLFNVGFYYAETECTVCPLGSQPSSSVDSSIVIDVLGEAKYCQDVDEMGMILLDSQELYPKYWKVHMSLPER